MPDAPTPSSTPSPTPKPAEPSLKSEAQRLADAAKDRAGDAIEELKVASNQIVDKVRELVEDANVRRVSIRREGKTLFEIPLTVGVGAGAAAILRTPILAAVGALAALVTDVTLVVERDEEAAAEAADDRVANANAPAASADAGDDKTVGKPPAA